MRITADTEGDASRHLTLEALTQALPGVRSPSSQGRLSLLVRRANADHAREFLDRVELSPERGLPGDAWEKREPLNPDAQLATMQTPVAELIANGQPLALSGDQLFLDVDLSAENLPIGSRLRIGNVLFAVTPKAHNGCKKFRARFGHGALVFVSAKERRHLNLRGIYLRVTEGGQVRLGDEVVVLSRSVPEQQL
jgi:hypothetical protein